MSENCGGTCGSCGEECEERTSDPSSFLEKPHRLSTIKKVIGIVSGKGGVGKSLVTSLLAAEMNRRGYKTAILDADITGPSIPRIFGVEGNIRSNAQGILPSESKGGVSIISANLLLREETDPMICRGPMIANIVKQFWTDVIWGEIDYMFVDMPPGTGDVPLTVFQSLPVDGIVIVTSPQELVSMIVAKAVKMADQMDIPVLGAVENMSFVECPHCEERIEVFGKSTIEEVAKEYGIETIVRVPMDPIIAKTCDQGAIEDFKTDYLDLLIERIEK